MKQILRSRNYCVLNWHIDTTANAITDESECRWKTKQGWKQKEIRPWEGEGWVEKTLAVKRKKELKVEEKIEGRRGIAESWWKKDTTAHGWGTKIRGKTVEIQNLESNERWICEMKIPRCLLWRKQAQVRMEKRMQADSRSRLEKSWNWNQLKLSKSSKYERISKEFEKSLKNKTRLKQAEQWMKMNCNLQTKMWNKA